MSRKRNRKGARLPRPGSINQTRQQIVQAVNVGLSGGYARLDGTNHLIVGTDTRGSGGAIVIQVVP